MRPGDGARELGGKWMDEYCCDVYIDDERKTGFGAILIAAYPPKMMKKYRSYDLKIGILSYVSCIFF